MTRQSGPLLTIGMATIRDYHGVYFTLQSLRLQAIAAGIHNDIEYVVVDQDPRNEHGEQCRQLVETYAVRHSAGARYYAMPEARGTTQPRQRIFDEARGQWVLVLDCHVLLPPGVLRLIHHWCATHPSDRDLHQGPLLYDGLDSQSVSTHFDAEWRGGMWGRWATDRAALATGKPFPIHAQGLGMFLGRRESWPGFDRRWRGFGGEEGCIHEVFRERGDRALCHPEWPWVHRFAKPGGVNVPSYTYSKVRNYVLGFQRVGRDIDEIRKHFVVDLANDPDPATRRQALAAAEWDMIVADPDRELPPGVRSFAEIEAAQAAAGPAASGGYVPEASSMPQPLDVSSVEAIAKWVRSQPRDLEKHADALASFASGHHVVEISKRRESAALLLGGRPKSLLSFCSERDALQGAIHHAIRAENPQWLASYTSGALTSPADSLAVEIPECDALFLDTIHSGQHVRTELERHGGKVRELIAIRGTGAFGDKAEGTSAPGLYFGIADWIEAERGRGRKWVRIYRTDHQYGLSIYSCAADAVDVDQGPGTELAGLLRQLGIVSGNSCDCKAKQAIMDEWGAAQCRERLDEIVGWLRDNAPRWGWAEKVKAAALAVTTGLAWSLDPTDPYRSLIVLAIERAESKAKGGAA